MKITFSHHAEEKLEILRRRGVAVTKEQVIDCLEKPDKIEEGYRKAWVAQKVMDSEHVLRVVFTEIEGLKRVVTLYPGRRSRYED